MASWKQFFSVCLTLVLVFEVAEVTCRRGRGRGPVRVVSQEEDSEIEAPTLRDGRFFSLFNVVNFNNERCASDNSDVSDGVCYTDAECSRRGGKNAGSCAAGFGVCCIFTVAGDSGTIDTNCTHIRNDGFPSPVRSGLSSYTIKKCSPDVCQLRLDFQSLVLMGIADTTETGANAVCMDSLRVTTSTGGTLPVICGTNTGQHIYVDIGKGAKDSVMLNIALAGANSAMGRTWDIKVSQISCKSNERAPDGCLQYVTGRSGRFTTFSYADTALAHLPNQNYNYCIRQEEGASCITYNVCGVAPGTTVANTGFSLNQRDPLNQQTAQQNNVCLQDYIGIPGGASTCERTFGARGIDSRFCGPFLNDCQSAVAYVPICSCTAPFKIEVHTDGGPDGGANTALSHGVCLDWEQS